tara:strand:+ start:6995 stop:7249 length:255 start_codon:yes stop_codon:yes gene_type:complete
MKMIKENARPEDANNRDLPNNAYLVNYLDEKDQPKYDIVMGVQVKIFDHYYDKYKKKFKGFEQTQGRISPKLWNPNPEKPGKKK